MRSILALVAVLLIASQAFAADPPPSNSRGIESLGNELLEDLTPKAFDAAAQRDNQDATQEDARNPVTRAPRFDDLGEDIGQPSGSLSLARVRLGMQHAQSLLGVASSTNNAPNLQQAADVQQEVVTQLDKLIAELSKQCKNCNGQSAGQSPKPSQRSQSKPGKPGKSSKAAGAGQTAARDSSDRLDSSTAQPADKGELEAVVKNLWGHLPERSREQMMQSFSEEFLPKYELEIEQYYRRLSEENNAGETP